MLIRLFRQNQPAALLLVVPLVFLLWPGARPHVADTSLALPHGMPLYRGLLHLLGHTDRAHTIMGGAVVALLAFLLNVWTNENEFFERRNHLPALLLLPLMALVPMGLALHPALVGMPLVLWALRRVWNRQGDQRVLGPLFDAGALIAIGSLFYLPYAFLVVVVWASLAVMRPFSWREYLMPVLGLATLLFIAWGVCHLLRPEAWNAIASLRTEDRSGALSYHQHWAFGVVLAVIMGAFALTSVLSFAQGYGAGVMREKNTRSAFLAFGFSLALIVAFEKLLGGAWPAAPMAVPLAVLFSWPLLRARSIGWAEAGVWFLLGLALWARWMG